MTANLVVGKDVEAGQYLEAFILGRPKAGRDLRVTHIAEVVCCRTFGVGSAFATYILEIYVAALLGCLKF